jgi:hypothetical protein
MTVLLLKLLLVVGLDVKILTRLGSPMMSLGIPVVVVDVYERVNFVHLLFKLLHVAESGICKIT